MIYTWIMALLLSRANLDLHPGKNPHKKCSKASLQVIKNPWSQRLETEEGRSKLCWKRRSGGQQKELWSSQQVQDTARSLSSPPPETNFPSGEREAGTDSSSDNYGGTHITNARKWAKTRWVSVLDISTELLCNVEKLFSSICTCSLDTTSSNGFWEKSRSVEKKFEEKARK